MNVDRLTYSLVLQVPCFRGEERVEIDTTTCGIAADWHEEHGTAWEETHVEHWLDEPNPYETPADFLRSRT